MNGIDDNEARFVREFVQGGRSAMPPGLDQRLRGALATTKPPRSRRWLLVAAVLLLGVTVTTAVLWDRRAADDALELPAMAPQDPKPAEVAEEPGKPPSLQALDIERSIAVADFLLVVDVGAAEADRSGHGKRHVLEARVRTVHKGQGIAPGQTVRLCWPGGEEMAQATAFDIKDLAAPGAKTAGTWLVALRHRDGQSSLEEPELAHATRDGMWAMRWGDYATDAAVSLPEHLFGALLHLGMRSRYRREALEMMCRWDGAADPARELLESSPWLDIAARRLLLNVADDSDPDLRLLVAEAIPAAVGDDGQHALATLCFDPYAQIRSQAIRTLRKIGAPAWIEQLPVEDGAWTMWTWPASQQRWFGLARTAAAKEGIEDARGVFVRQLLKSRVDNHVLGAIGLGTCGDAQALEDLRALAIHDDLRVRAAAARSRVQLGERSGHDALAELLRGADMRGASMAIDMLATLDTKDAFDLLASAADDERPLVRARIAGALRSLREDEPNVVDALLGDLRKDADPMVAAAAGAR